MDWENLDERDVFLQRFIGLCQFFGIEADEFRTQIYFRALNPYPVQDVVQGVDKAISKCRFFPRPVELLEFIEGKVEDRAEVEAGKVYQAIVEVSGSKAVVFDDPVTAAVVARGFGGWARLCSTLKESELTWFTKDFCRRYVSFTHQNVEHVGALPGRNGTEQIALVGDTAKAQAALAAGNARQGAKITMLTGGMAKSMAIGA